MLHPINKIKSTAIITKAIFSFTIFLAFISCKKTVQPLVIPIGFSQVNLVANSNVYNAKRTDDSLINGWGLVFSPLGIPWISSEGGSVSLIYDSIGNQVLPPVSIPSAGHPTGIVYNASSTDFVLPGGSVAQFIFVGSNGIIYGWASGSTAETALDRSATSSYTGVTIARDSSGSNFLYAANFKLAKIDVFDSAFNEVNNQFTDTTLPAGYAPFTDTTLPAGYAPFNIQNIGGQLYVLYAKIGPDSLEEKGANLGYVDIYNPDGSFVQRFISQGPLNAPWGIVQAPLEFVNFNNEKVILVGNFGDGTINAFLSGGDFIGTLNSNGKVISIDGLWGLAFPPDSSGNLNRLYFTAGPNDEKDGLFGYIKNEQK